MKRRDFLVGAAAGAAAIVGSAGTGSAQAPAPTPAAGQGGQGRGGRGGRGGGPANVAPEKLARVSIMTLNHGSMLKLPWNATPNENQTIALLDLPQFYVDLYGVHNIEFQHSHLAQGNNDPDLAMWRELRAKLDALKSTATQINLEFGQQNISNADAALRKEWVERTKKWTDAALVLGVKRLMLNQGTLNQETKAHAIATWKEAVAYAAPKGIMISAETRGGGGGGRGAATAGAAGAPPAPPPPPPTPAWMLLEEVIEAAGGHSNIDIGGAGAPNQQALHDAIKGMFRTSSGNMHIKSSPNWDIGKAVAFTESLGYKGRYSIEVNQDPAIRIVYNTILANVT